MDNAAATVSSARKRPLSQLREDSGTTEGAGGAVAGGGGGTSRLRASSVIAEGDEDDEGEGEEGMTSSAAAGGEGDEGEEEGEQAEGDQGGPTPQRRRTSRRTRGALRRASPIRGALIMSLPRAPLDRSFGVACCSRVQAAAPLRWWRALTSWTRRATLWRRTCRSCSAWPGSSRGRSVRGKR